MKRKFIIFGIVLLMIVNISALTTIGYHRWCPYHGERNRCELPAENYLYQELSLSRSQIEQMKVIKQSFHVQVDQISEQLFTRRTELVNLLKTSEPDCDRIHQVIHEIGSLQTKLQQHVINSVLKEKTILSPEQQEKFFLIINDRLIYEARCKQSSRLNSLENNCNPNCNQLKTN